MKKVGLIMRKVQFAEAQGPRVFAETLREIGRRIGVEVVFLSPERHVTAHGPLPGYEYEKGDLVNYDIVLEQIERAQIEHVLYTVAGFSFLKLFVPKTALFPHSFPDPELAGSAMMLPFYQMVDTAVVQTAYLQQRIREYGVQDVSVVPIGFEEALAKELYDPLQVQDNRVLWIGRDEANRQPELVIEYARQNPQADVQMVFGGERYRASMQRFALPANLKLHFALSRREIFTLLNTAKVYWSCSRFDTFAMPLAEALAMGKLVVKPEHPCYGHIHARHAFAGNRENWFDLVNMALAMPMRTSTENRAYAFAHFTSEHMRQGWEAFLTAWMK